VEAHENFIYAKEELLNEISMFLRFLLQSTSEKLYIIINGALRASASARSNEGETWKFNYSAILIVSDNIEIPYYYVLTLRYI